MVMMVIAAFALMAIAVGLVGSDWQYFLTLMISVCQCVPAQEAGAA